MKGKWGLGGRGGAGGEKMGRKKYFLKIKKKNIYGLLSPKEVKLLLDGVFFDF